MFSWIPPALNKGEIQGKGEKQGSFLFALSKAAKQLVSWCPSVLVLRLSSVSFLMAQVGAVALGSFRRLGLNSVVLAVLEGTRHPQNSSLCIGSVIWQNITINKHTENSWEISVSAELIFFFFGGNSVVNFSKSIRPFSVCVWHWGGPHNCWIHCV